MSQQIAAIPERSNTFLNDSLTESYETAENLINPYETGIRPEDLTGWKKVTYDIALLAPKLIFSGAGWAAGFCFGANVGAGVGDMLGTFVGCALSLGIELLLRKYVLEDPTLNQDGAIWRITKSRLKSAVILSAGSLVGGMIFNTALTKWAAPLVFGNVHIVQALATGAITAGFFASGMTAARALYTGAHKLASSVFKMGQDRDYDELALSWKNLKGDIKLSALLIAPAQVAFTATSVPLFGITTFMGTKFAALKAAATVLIGGTTAKAISGTVEELSRPKQLHEREVTVEKKAA